jgi:hypothetical protein
LLLSIFQIGSHIFCPRPAWTTIHLPMASHIAEITGAYNHTQLIGWYGASLTSSLDWARTMILPISASWVAGITGVYHHAWPTVLFLYLKFYWKVDLTLKVHIIHTEIIIITSKKMGRNCWRCWMGLWHRL